MRLLLRTLRDRWLRLRGRRGNRRLPSGQVLRPVQRGGVAVEVFVRPELRGVDEDGENDGSGLFSGQFDKADVAFMQGPHGHDHANELSAEAEFFRNGLHFDRISEGLHRIFFFCCFLFRWLDGDDKLSSGFCC